MYSPTRLFIIASLSAVVLLTACSDEEQAPSSSNTDRESITDPATQDGQPQNMEEQDGVDPDLQVEESDEQMMDEGDERMEENSVDQDDEQE